ncbi:MAG TPA: Wadjet anti-phage system protein JetD domain-containing protein [Steroidobacteraceae bacterium]|nr:Wadjet anti-phage system protein JetD domain-containing protein [Steroidobacteraceae bacterium]
MHRPPWLTDEPEITAMLHAVVDRFDKQSGNDRALDVFIPVARVLPSLTSGDSQADDLWLLVKSLGESGLLKFKPGKRSLYDPEWTNAKLAFPAASEPILREWLQREPATRVMQEWRDAVHEHEIHFPHGLELLKLRRIDVPGRTPREIVAALASIHAIKGQITLRQLSARVFWGDSKLLDKRADFIAALFPHLEIRERPIVVSVYLPSEYAGVLFIENQDTYAAAIRSQNPKLQRLAFVYASGFRSSAARIRARDGATLHFAGPGATALIDEFQRWWFRECEAVLPTAFWGDLDFAGMQILKSLRARFENLESWKSGYAWLLPLAHQQHSQTLDSREQIDPVVTGDTYADETLLPAIRAHGFVDQEAVEIP